MICYKDKTFCSAVCASETCHRKFTPDERAGAERLGLPICWGDMQSDTCGHVPIHPTIDVYKIPCEGGEDCSICKIIDDLPGV